jgi:small subunit ribosomal protein S1
LTAEQSSEPQTSATGERDEAMATTAVDSGDSMPVPSDDGGIDSSGSSALGDAAEVSERVAQAVGAATAERGEGAGRQADVRGNTSAGSDAATGTLTSELEQAPPAMPTENGSGPVDLGPEPTTMEELLGEQTENIKSFKHGDVVEGTVVRIDKDEILVDIGAKSEGVVSNRELYGRHQEGQTQLKIGDVVLVYVLQPESNEGHVVLSLRRAGLERKWRSMQEQFESGVIIEAPVIDHNKGGLIVDCGIRGFVPISQIVDFPRRPQNDQPRDAAQEIAEKLMPFVGRKLRLKILEVNRKANRLILSEKVALYEERREKRDELFSSLKVGQRVKGTVRSIAPFGVFVDLGGIDGLVHKSELSWNKVNNPEAGYRMGEEVEAEVIDINHERGRISLSIRRLQPDPWHSTVADFRVGDVIDGTVTKIVNFGAFVRVREGLEGLIHISELSHQRVAHPADVVHEGQRLKLKIISLDQERHRLGLSLKQAEEPPARPPEQAAAPPQRRGRGERGYDATQAVQEPEGGIDNTLAAAFAQVRQQVEDSERGDTDETAEAPGQTRGEAEMTAEAPEQTHGEAEATAEAPEQARADEQQAGTARDEPAAVAAAETANEPSALAETAAETAIEVPAPAVVEAGTAAQSEDEAAGTAAAARKGSRTKTAKSGSRSAKSETEQGAGSPSGARGPTDAVAAAQVVGDGAAEGAGTGGEATEPAFETTSESSPGGESGSSDESGSDRGERSSPDA